MGIGSQFGGLDRGKSVPKRALRIMGNNEGGLAYYQKEDQQEREREMVRVNDRGERLLVCVLVLI